MVDEEGQHKDTDNEGKEQKREGCAKVVGEPLQKEGMWMSRAKGEAGWDCEQRARITS